MDADVAETDRLFPANRRLLREARRLDVSLAGGREVEGLLEEREGLCLYMLARWGGRLGGVVEIGSWKGRSTWYLARGLADSGSPHQVTAIDPHLEGTRDTFVANLERTGISDRVEPRFEYAQDVVDDFQRAVGVLWIDGDHSYAAACRDFEQWFPLLAEGGWVAFHDTVNRWRGPTRLVRRLLATRSDLASVGVMGTITFARKVAPRHTNRLRALSARIGFELVTAIWGFRVGFGPVDSAPGERKLT